MKPLKKAWELNKSCLYDPHHTPDDIVYAETEGEAKSKFLSQKNAEDYGDSNNGAPLTFLTIKVQRCPDADLYLTDDGTSKTKGQIEYEIALKARNDEVDELVHLNPDGKAYIMKNGYYYRPNSRGYTGKVAEAGVYTVQEAAASVKGCGYGDHHMKMIVIDVETHNRLINEEIAGLQERLIK